MLKTQQIESTTMPHSAGCSQGELQLLGLMVASHIPWTVILFISQFRSLREHTAEAEHILMTICCTDFLSPHFAKLWDHLSSTAFSASQSFSWIWENVVREAVCSCDENGCIWVRSKGLIHSCLWWGFYLKLGPKTPNRWASEEREGGDAVREETPWSSTTRSALEGISWCRPQAYSEELPGWSLRWRLWLPHSSSVHTDPKLWSLRFGGATFFSCLKQVRTKLAVNLYNRSKNFGLLEYL